jgi:hypothetical protein
MGEQESIFQSLPENLPKGKPAEPEVVLPDELKGKTPQEIYKRLSEEHQRVVGDINKDHQLEMATAKSQTPPGGVPQQQQQQQQQQRQTYYPPQQQEEDIDYMTQPEAYIERALNKKMEPLVGAFVSSQKENAKRVFMQQVGKEEWDLYGPEIEKFVDGLHPSLQINPQSYEAGYKVVRGDHVDEISQKKAVLLTEQTLRKVLTNMGISEEVVASAMRQPEGAGQQQAAQAQPRSSLFQPVTGLAPHVETSRAFNPEQQKSKVKLTPIQHQMAEEFGMTDDEYAEHAKLNTDVLSEVSRGELK